MSYASPFPHSIEKLYLPFPSASHPNYQKYEKLLEPGWIPGRKFDNTDAQYSGFRENVPYMFLLVVLHPLLRKIYDRLVSSNNSVPDDASCRSGARSQVIFAEARLNQRVNFDLYFALVYLCALNGFSALKVLLILFTNFHLATRLPRQYVPAATWIFNIGILFANELCRGYPYAEMARLILPWSGSEPTGTAKGSQKTWGSYLDEYGGLMPRWEILFNITVLRLISFNLDYCWSLGRNGSNSLEVSLLQTDTTQELELIKIRRNNLTRQTFRNVNELTLLQTLKTTTFATILLTSSTHHSIWLALSLLLMTIYRRPDTLLKV